MTESTTSGDARKPRSHVVLAVIGSVAMAYVLRLSAPERGPVDWVVIAAVAAAIAWQLWRLGVRLYAVGGSEAVWHELRTLGFWLIGLMNTVWAVPGDEGTWKWWGGVVVLLVAAADTVAVYLRERRALRGAAPT